MYYIHKYIHICTYKHSRTNTHIQAYMYAHTQIRIHTGICTYMYTRMHKYIHKRVHIHTWFFLSK